MATNLSNLIGQFTSTSFLQMLLFSCLLGLAIVLLSFAFAFYSISRIRGNRLILFALGLFLLFSFSPVLKTLAISRLPFPEWLHLTTLYMVHLLPLYSLIFLFAFSFLNKHTFDYSKCYGVSYFSLLRFFVAKLWMTIAAFWNFSIVYIIFDTSKDLINSRFFSFQEIRERLPSYAGVDVSPLTVDITNMLPVILFLIPAGVFLIMSSPVNLSNNQSDQTFFTPNLSFLRVFFKRIKRIFSSVDSITTFVVMCVPYMIYCLLVISIFNLITIIDSITMRNTLVFSIVVSVSVVYCFLHASKLRRMLIPVLFFLALIPGEIIANVINNEFLLSNLFEFLHVDSNYLFYLRLALGMFLFYGIFPLFFVNLSSLQHENANALSKNYCLAIHKKIQVTQLLNFGGIILSLVFFSILICNDSALISGLVFPNAKEQSFAYALSEAILNNKDIGTLHLQLIFANIILIVTAPFFPMLLRLVIPIPSLFMQNLR